MKKRLLITIFLIVSFKSFSQKLECCQSIEEVIEKLQGNWLLKNDHSNLIYQFHFNGEIGRIYEFKKENLESGRITVNSGQPVLKLTKNIFGYKIEFIGMSARVKGRIKLLDNNSFIFNIKGTIVEYSKYEN
jgi:hypothetical protein